MAKRTTLNSTDCYGRSYFRTRHYLSLQTTSHKPLVVKTRGRDFLCFFLFGSNLESWSFPFNTNCTYKITQNYFICLLLLMPIEYFEMRMEHPA